MLAPKGYEPVTSWSALKCSATQLEPILSRSPFKFQQDGTTILTRWNAAGSWTTDKAPTTRQHTHSRGSHLWLSGLDRSQSCRMAGTTVLLKTPMMPVNRWDAISWMPLLGKYGSVIVVNVKEALVNATENSVNVISYGFFVAYCNTLAYFARQSCWFNRQPEVHKYLPIYLLGYSVGSQKLYFHQPKQIWVA